MRLRLAVIIAVLLLVVLSVAGCLSFLKPPTGSTSTVSTDYPTSGRSKLVEAAVEDRRADFTLGYQDEKSLSFDVNWISDTQVQIQDERISTKTYETWINEYTITHFPSTEAATAVLNSKVAVYPSTPNPPLSSPVIDYYKITGKTPTVYKNYDIDKEYYPGSLFSIWQFDSLIIEGQFTTRAPNSGLT